MILVVGATGTLGGMIARQLLQQGKQVRALVRPQSDYEALREAGAELAFGDLKDRDSLEAASQGVEVVITTANSALRGGDDNPQTVDLEGNHSLIEAARAVGARQFVFVSALGADPNSPVPLLAAKRKTEECLRDSGIGYTILAPNVFVEGWVPMIVGGPVQAGQPVTLVGEGRRRHSMVSINDVAAFAVAVVDHPRAMNQHIPLGGPEALSWRDIVAIFERVLGRKVPVNTIPPGESLPGLPEVVSQLAAGLDTYDSPVDMTESARAFGVSLTPVEAFVRQTYG